MRACMYVSHRSKRKRTSEYIHIQKKSAYIQNIFRLTTDFLYVKKHAERDIPSRIYFKTLLDDRVWGKRIEMVDFDSWK